MKLLLPILILLVQSNSFTRFTYCKQITRGMYELQCVELNPAGKGLARLKRRGFDEVKVEVQLSTTARDRFLAALAATNNLDQAETYESGRRVADLGQKRLTLEMTSGDKREAKFNYSIRKEVTDLVTFFDGIVTAEMWGMDIETALQFDKLGIPKKVEQIENDLKGNRISDPERLIPILDKIQGDARLINYARALAGKIKEQILAKKAIR